MHHGLSRTTRKGKQINLLFNILFKLEPLNAQLSSLALTHTHVLAPRVRGLCFDWASTSSLKANSPYLFRFVCLIRNNK